jgi:hypothetical protein
LAGDDGTNLVSNELKYVSKQGTANGNIAAETSKDHEILPMNIAGIRQILV